MKESENEGRYSEGGVVGENLKGVKLSSNKKRKFESYLMDSKEKEITREVIKGYGNNDIRKESLD
jgi:hypothetical protein